MFHLSLIFFPFGSFPLLFSQSQVRSDAVLTPSSIPYSHTPEFPHSCSYSKPFLLLLTSQVRTFRGLLSLRPHCRQYVYGKKGSGWIVESNLGPKRPWLWFMVVTTLRELEANVITEVCSGRRIREREREGLVCVCDFEDQLNYHEFG